MSEDTQLEEDVFGLGPAPVSQPKREVPIDTGMYELSRSHVAAHVTLTYLEHPGCDIYKSRKECKEEMKTEEPQNTGEDAQFSTESSVNQNGFLLSTDQDMKQMTKRNAPSEHDKDDVTKEAGCYGNGLTEAQTISKDDVIHGQTAISSSLSWTKL